MRRLRLENYEPSRLLSEGETAHVLGLSASEFSRRKLNLEALGLPHRHPVLGRRDRKAVDRWLDEQFGLETRPADVGQIIAQRLAVLEAGK